MRKDIKDSIDNYVKYGIPPGDFLTAVLSNDLMGAFGRADIENRHDLFDICKYIWNDIPLTCHGSPKKVRNWLDYHANKREQERREIESGEEPRKGE